MALGRGLSALITSTGKSKITVHENSDDNDQKIWYIPVSKITPHAKQPRRNFAEAELAELAASIKEHGVLQPLLVTEKDDGGYEIVAGERRWRASQLAGLPTVPAIIKQLAEQTKLEIALIENIQREDLNPIEEAFAYKRLIEEFGLTQQQVADKVSKSRPAVANTIRLLDLPEPIQAALVKKQISTGQARTLLSLPGAREQLDMLSSMMGEKITVRELEREVNKKSNGLHARRDANLVYLEDQLRAALGTKVNITKKGERGTIVINYYSTEEFNQLIKKLTE